MDSRSITGTQRENVKVVVRTRPTGNFAEKNIILDKEGRAIDIYLPKNKDLLINNQQERWSFQVDNVLNNASQEAVFESCASDIIASTMEGFNGTIMAYGQTGAGKTFTMIGGSSSYKQRGIIPRAVSDVFRLVASRPDIAYKISVSYLEIYNELFFDLLDPDCKQLEDLAIRDNEAGAVEVKGLTRALVDSEEAALNYLFQGETNRSIAEHEMNKSSTRSHCIFTIYLESRSRVDSSEKVVSSKLNLVDLAGSERVGKTGSTGTILTEARYINKSLTFLEQVVVALGDKSREHVPFRQSKLTNVLRDSLGGNCKTRLIANISTETRNLEETISTLRFAMRMMRVSTRATVNETVDPLALVAKLQRQVRDLKQELAMHDTLANRGASIQYDNYTPEQQAELAAIVRGYITGAIPEIEVQNLRQIQELLKQFRVITLQYQQQAAVAAANSLAGYAASGTALGASASLASTAGPFSASSPTTGSSANSIARGAQSSTGAATSRGSTSKLSGAPKVAGSAGIRTGDGSVPTTIDEGGEGTPVLSVSGGGAAARAGTISNVGEVDSAALSFHLGVAGSDARPVAGADALALKQNTPRIGHTMLPGGGGAAGAGFNAVAAVAAATGDVMLSSSAGDGGAFRSGFLSQVPTTAAAGQNGAPISGVVGVATNVGGGGIAAVGSGGRSHLLGALKPPSEEVAFKEFREREGSELDAVFEQNKTELNVKKNDLAALTDALNAVKREIDELNSRVRTKRSDREAQAAFYQPSVGEVTIIDEEEYAFIRDLKKKKAEYAKKFSARKAAADEVSYLKQLTDQAKLALAEAFLAHYANVWGNKSGTNSNGSVYVGAGGETDSGGLSSPPSAASSQTAPGDQLDYGEQFDKLECDRLVAQDPDSVHFYKAQKNVFGVASSGGASASASAAGYAQLSGKGSARMRARHAAQRFRL